jgi:hypothetical protein
MKPGNLKFGLLLASMLVVVPSTSALAPKPPHLAAETSSFEGDQSRTGGVLVLQLRAGGFAPREVTRPAGHYLVLINNVSGSPEVTLQLRRAGEERSHQVTLKRGSSWRQHVRLTPGIYLVTEANHPDWVCRVTMTAD